MKKYKAGNDDYVWILTGVEVLSRFAFALPIHRKDRISMKEAMNTLLDKFTARFGEPPKVKFDEGKGFYNVGVRSLREENKIRYFSTYSEKKATIVERFNRTFKTMMWKYFYSADTHRWLDVLDDFVKNCNNTKHGTILMKSADVNKSNEEQVWTTLFGHAVGHLPMPKFFIGDRVRISSYKSIFTKGYEANFTEEIFKIWKT